MANDFSGDANCVALYKFENDWPNDSVLDDTGPVGTNHMDDINTVATEAVLVKEGSQSANFTSANSEGFGRVDADLSAGFPLKSSGGSKVLSICCWMRFKSGAPTADFIAKYRTTDNQRSLKIQYNTTPDAIEIYVGYNSGASFTKSSHLGTIATGIWYHIGLTYDDTGGGDGKGQVKVRIWDDNASAILQSGGNDTFSEDIGQNVSLETNEWMLGCSADRAAPTVELNGYLDEVVIFKDLLITAEDATNEIDKIRAGTYGAAAIEAGKTMGAIARWHMNQRINNS